MDNRSAHWDFSLAVYKHFYSNEWRAWLCMTFLPEATRTVRKTNFVNSLTKDESELKLKKSGQI